MRILFLIFFSFSIISASASNAPLPFFFQNKTNTVIEPCTATITDSRDFYVYNCNGNTYHQRLTATCTRTFPTCTEASTSASNCVDNTLTTEGAAWKEGVKKAHCPPPPPEEVIDWID